MHPVLRVDVVSLVVNGLISAPCKRVDNIIDSSFSCSRNFTFYVDSLVVPSDLFACAKFKYTANIT